MGSPLGREEESIAAGIDITLSLAGFLSGGGKEAGYPLGSFDGCH
jgi:hypothetical protein